MYGFKIIMCTLLTMDLSGVFSAPNKKLINVKGVKKHNLTNNAKQHFITTVNNMESIKNFENLNRRAKRQVGSGAGKFIEAAKMPQIKIFRLFLQMFANIGSDSDVGGDGPFDVKAVRPVLYLFKDKIIAFFFPVPGEEHQKKSH